MIKFGRTRSMDYTLEQWEGDNFATLMLFIVCRDTITIGIRKQVALNADVDEISTLMFLRLKNAIFTAMYHDVDEVKLPEDAWIVE